MKRARAQRMFLPILLCGTLAWTSCSTNWIGEAEKIINVLIPAAANVMTLVATLQGDVPVADLQMAQNIGSEVNADLQLLQSLIGQYQKATPSLQPGLSTQIQAALDSVQSELNALLPALHIKDAATQEKVNALVGIVLSEVQSMAAIVPAVTGTESSVTLKEAAKPGTRRIPLSANDFVSLYDAAMARKTGNTKLDHETSGLQIHGHRKLVRLASAGLLN